MIANFILGKERSLYSLQCDGVGVDPTELKYKL